MTLAACPGGDSGEKGGKGRAAAGGQPVNGGTLIIASSDIDHLFPQLSVNFGAKNVTDQMFDYLADIGDELNTLGDAGFTPRLATRWEWAPDSLSITFHLDPRARWHDGQPVRASDVRFTHQIYHDPASTSLNYELISTVDSVQVVDSLTPRIWYRRRGPEQFFDAVYQMPILPEHVLKGIAHDKLRQSEFARSPIGSGKFRFVRWTPGQQIELIADTANYRGRPRLDRVIYSIVADYPAALTRLRAGEADFYETIRPENVAEVDNSPTLKAIPYQGSQYGFMGMNLRENGPRGRPHPVFGDRTMRRALTMAVDRRALVRSVFDTLAYPSIGPVTRGQSVADTTIAQIPFDTVRAKQLLDSLGWRDANGDGVRERNGRPLEFAIIVPSISASRVRLATLVQAQLKRVGVTANLEQLEFGAFLERLRRRQYDAAMSAWTTDPSPSGIRQLWTTAGSRSEDGSNYQSYESPAFDAYVDSAARAATPAARKAYFRRAYETIVGDAPSVWIYEQRLVAGAHERLRTAPMRADGWWAHLDQWWIPSNARIPRDQIGLRTVAER
ncbi:MAG TPA: peptide ABC transporter substrate-binding protein [Gemmatimonadaceae bacterium]|nr:peptide ABC transporter substrate-binding protein [Gemmatimonadaceae bacterium]